MTGDAVDDSHPLPAIEAAEAELRSALAEQLRAAVAEDEAATATLRDWTSRGHLSLDRGDGAAIDRAAARQASVLTNHARYRAALGRDPPPVLRTTPVAPFEGLDRPPAVEVALDDLRSELADDPGDATDLLGARYADALADDERRSRGQFYTPPTVARLVVDWALCPAEDAGRLPRVLDPAAGTGTFPLAAYDCLRERDSDADPGALLSRIVAVDVDEVALHLAALRLSARTDGGPIEAFDRRACSFFDLDPRSVESDDGVETVAPVDAVVGNPPFVRAGDLSPDRDHFRRHLEAFGPGDDAPYANGERALTRRSDAYVYFVTHATRFLRPGGRLGVVLPAKWLESDYGAGFRRFLADQYRVRAVVGFGARAFDALVDTVLLLAERRERPVTGDRVGLEDGDCADGVPRVRFVRLDEPLSTTSTLADLLSGASDGSGAEARPGGAAPSGGASVPASRRDGRVRVVRRSQQAFATAEKCSPYLRAPEALLPLLDHPAFVPLGDLARVSRGVTTGANRFFLLDGQDRERWGIDPALLRPAVRSIRGVESRSVRADDVDLSMLDVHGFLAERGDRTEGDATDPTDQAKAALRGADHDGLVAYVEHAEAEGWHEGRTCQARRVWFDLGDLPTPDAFVPKLLRERVFTVRNRADAVPTNAIDCLSVREGVDPDVLLGVLDSSLCRALMEVWGRNEAGMLQLMTYETRTLPVPDVRAFAAEEAAAIRDAEAALDADGTGQAALDAAVHDALDLDLPADRAWTLRERLLARRVDGGDRVETPVQ